jgi:hypothetical protein
MKSLLRAFNAFFRGKAKAVINGNRLEITIDSQTIIISLPEEVGGQSTPKD